MPTIDEIFAAMPAEAAEDAHEYLVIDPVTRTITVPESEKVFGVEGDSDAERKYFLCPRYVGDGLDLASMFLTVNYRNAQGAEDGYLVTDVAVVGDNVTFSWEIWPNVVAFKGTIQFAVCADLPNTSSRRGPDWNTTLANGEVLEGLDPDRGDVLAETSDVVTQLRAETAAQTEAVEATGAAQVAAVKAAATTATQEAVAAVQAQGEATNASIPAEYTELEATVDRLTRDRAAAIVCEAEGELLHISDASNDPLQGLRIFGRTKQWKTTGAQLIPQPYFNGNKTYNGVTWVINDGGSVDVRGTATANSPLYFTNSAHELAPGQYTISGSAKGVAVRVDSTNRETGEWTTGVAISKNGEPVTFTITEEDAATYTYTVYASVESGSKADTTIYPMLNAGPSALPWEPYSNGLTSPSPEWPQEMKSIQAPVVNVYGKNLFDNTAATKTVSGITFTINEDKSVTLNGTATATIYFELGTFKLLPGEYYLSGCNDGSGTSYLLYFQKTKDSTGYIQCTTAQKAFTTYDNDERKMLIAVYSGAVVSNKTLYPMVRYTHITDQKYEPYKGGALTITTPGSLPGIPVANGGNYTDADGQQWISDEVDLARGVYVQRVSAVTLDETKPYKVNSYQLNTLGKYLFEWYPGNLPQAETDAPAMADKLAKANWGAFTASETKAKLYATSGRLIVFLPDQTIQTVEAFQEYLATNPITALYALAAPVETPLTDVELQAYLALHSVKPTTTVLNDAGAHMVLEYAADPKTYIDNKLAANS